MRKEMLITKIVSDNYQQKLWQEMISDTQLSGEIMTGNYELVYYVAENVEIIVMLAYQNHLGTIWIQYLRVVQWKVCEN